MKDNIYRCLKIISFSSCLMGDVALGQITPDGSLPTQVQVNTLEPKTIIITGGTQAGGNLFHSFNEFSVPNGNTAYFNNANNVNNIIGRITGGKVSHIDGVIRTNKTSNLFLMNPAGFIFGANAKLNVGGSFVATSASSIKFADGIEFGVNLATSSSLLTVVVPVGLQFGSQPPGEIINHSQSLPLSSNNTPSGLRVKTDKTLALIGGNVILENGNLTAIAGRIEIGSVAENSYVSLTPIEKGWEVGYQGSQDFRDVLLNQRSIIDASGNGGSVQIQGRYITIAEGSQIGLVPLDDKPTGNLTINGSESVELIGGKVLNEQREAALTGLFVFGVNDVDGGSIIINTRNFSLRDGAGIDVATVGAGQGGDLLIKASESTEIMGTGFFEASLISTNTFGSGKGGNIDIETGTLSIRDGGAIFADTTILESSVAQGAGGTGGKITIKAQDVEISGSGITSVTQEPRSSIISASSGDLVQGITGLGDGGSIEITTERLIIKDGASIEVSSFQKEGEQVERSGAAGILTVKARSILLDNRAQINAIAQNNDGSGGNISLTATDSLEMRRNSSISAQAGFMGGAGNGGNIDINSRFIIAASQENSDIDADAGQGNGGNINITTTGIFGLQVREERTPLSDITASSETGISGIVTINRPDVDAQGNLITLPTEVTDTDNLVVQSCGTGRTIAGEFLIIGKGGLPADPTQSVDFNPGLADLGEITTGQLNSSSKIEPPSDEPRQAPEPIIEAQGWITDEQGQIVLTAQATTVTSQAHNNPTKCSGP